MVRVGFICFLWMCAFQNAHAGAWNFKQGEGQIISTYENSYASSAFSDIDMDMADLSFIKQEGRLFVEHGLNEKVTLVVNGAHQTLQLAGAGNELNFSDFGDIELGARYQIACEGDWVLALQGSYIIGGGPPRSLLDINGPDDSVELRGLWGRSKDYDRSSVFVDAQFALRSQNLDRIDEWHSDFTLGVSHDEKYMLIGQFLHATQASFGPDDFRVPVQKRTKLKGSFVYSYKPNRNVEIGYSQTVFGRNTVREAGFFVGTWLRY